MDNWITVLGPLLTAGIGAFVAVRVAGMGSKAEHKRWVRDKREQAYRTFLGARNRWVDVSVQKGDAMQAAARVGEEAARSFNFGPWLRAQDEAWAEVVRTSTDVDFYGTVAARDLVRAWMSHLRSLYMMGTRSGGRFGGGIHEVEKHEAATHLDPFLRLVRKELGITDL